MLAGELGVSARLGTILGALEIVVFVALGVWLIAKGGSANTLSVGFEASAPLAGEARDPKRTIKVAVLTSCLAIGIFYVFTTYAGDVFFGPRRYVKVG